RAGARPSAVWLGAVPGATFLANAVPWWDAPHPSLVLAVLVAVIAGGVGASAAAWRRHPWGPATVLAATTAAVLAGDALTGSRLQMCSLYGQSPLIAGRFYGFGNSTFAVFAVAVLWLAAGRRAPRTALAIGAAAVAVDGWPAWGADFGGVLALVPAFALLVLWLAGKVPGTRALTLAGGAAVGAVALIAWLDWLRPERSRSHLGAF